MYRFNLTEDLATPVSPVEALGYGCVHQQPAKLSLHLLSLSCCKISVFTHSYHNKNSDPAWTILYLKHKFSVTSLLHFLTWFLFSEGQTFPAHTPKHLSSMVEFQTFKNRLAMEMLTCQLAAAAVTHSQQATLQPRGTGNGQLWGIGNWV